MKLTKYSQLLHGMKVRCKIEGNNITDAKLSKGKYGRYYICQNEKKGATADDKLGYKYSWYLAYRGEDADKWCICVTNLESVKEESKKKPEQWTPHYTRGGDTLEENRITIDGKEYTPEELKKICNRYRAALAAHSKYFPPAK